MRSWVKAGLIGGILLAVLNLMGLVPIFVIGLVTCCVSLLAYLAVGAVAAHWLPAPRQTGPAAGEGALAGGLAAAIGGLVNALILAGRAAVTGSDAVLTQLGPDMLQTLRDAGITPEQLQVCAGPVGMFFGGSTCCLVFILAGAALGALGGLAWAAMRPDA